MSRSQSRKERISRHPPVPCWFCGSRHGLTALMKDSIIVSRSTRDGGPYRICLCPSCLTECMLEETVAGRWFNSPNVRVGLLDYLFAPSPDAGVQSQLILKAISWLRENEDRRRYFFERDGDRRYSSTSFLKRLWPWGWSVDEDAAAELEFAAKSDGGTQERQWRPDSGSRRAASDDGAGEAGERRGAAGDEEPTQERARRAPPEDARPHILTPHEILGVPAEATLQEIKRRFHFLAVRYHPDKVHHLGAEFQDHAHAKFIELQQAYAALVRRHGSG